MNRKDARYFRSIAVALVRRLSDQDVRALADILLSSTSPTSNPAPHLYVIEGERTE